MPIVDTHVHYWVPSTADRPWDPKGANLGPTWPAEAMLDAAARAGVDRIVDVVPSMMGTDNRYGLEEAERHPERIVGVYGRFDPTLPDIAGRLRDFAAHPAMLGMRITLLDQDSSRWLTDGTLDALLAETAKIPLPVAILAPRRADALGALARRHPDAIVLVDHMAMSHADPEPFAQWNDVLALRALPNVIVKVTYFPEAAHEPFPFPSVRRYAKELYETFGAERLVWGSNFPPSQRACPYEESVRYFKELDVIPEGDKARIFGETFLNLVARTQRERAAR